MAGGTARHLLKNVRPNSASLLLLDEASMMAGPQHLALTTLLRADAQMLIAGDHRQLGVISQHDFAADQRPNVVRYRAYLSAYDFTRLLCRAPGSGAVSRALSFTHRLPAALRELLTPEYVPDGIKLRGRPPPRLLPLPPDAGDSPWGALWVQGGEPTEGVFLVVYDEAASGRTNVLEVELARRILEASPWHVAAAAAAAAAGVPERAQEMEPWWRGHGQGAAAPQQVQAPQLGMGLLEMQSAMGYRVGPPQSAAPSAMLRPAGSGLVGTGRQRRATFAGSRTVATTSLGASSKSSGGNGAGGNGSTPNYGSGPPPPPQQQQQQQQQRQGGGGGGGGGSVALITPHRAQRRLLQSLTRDLGLAECRVDTVDKMQVGWANGGRAGRPL